MRKLLLIGALCLGTAGAINLSDYKREDLCLERYPLWFTYNQIDYVNNKSIDLLPSQVNQLVDKLKKEGIYENTNCKFYIELTSESFRLSSFNNSILDAHLTLLDIYRFNTINGIMINNSYSTNINLEGKDVSDIQFKVYLMYDALITRLLLDLQP